MLVHLLFRSYIVTSFTALVFNFLPFTLNFNFAGYFFFFFQAEDGIRDATVTRVQTCALPISPSPPDPPPSPPSGSCGSHFETFLLTFSHADCMGFFSDRSPVPSEGAPRARPPPAGRRVGWGGPGHAEKTHEPNPPGSGSCG